MVNIPVRSHEQSQIAKENLRSLFALARTGADRNQVGQPRWKFLTWCADSDVPEMRQLAVTVDR
ncbi:MAG: hypothetical protein JF597_39390 [Streptomyces sp.]|uniref:hypothetical protein n=1 Tax=Streptomyces sp. TaxID=1931 RepID=UPI0025D2A88F|nr:hypothetical protein [Streptomyces sp.]MBW8799425.1 hypothetical protein [Streptomyces sp.]